MRALSSLFLCTVLIATASPAQFLSSGQPASAATLAVERWPARWITAPAAPKNEYGVFLFRKQLELAQRPARFVVHVTADARYRLFVNGTSVAFGPQRSDSWICRYDSIDLAPWLREGTNVLAAEVYSFGEGGPVAIVSAQTSLLVQGDGAAEQVANTGATWKVVRDAAYTPVSVFSAQYLVTGAGDRVTGAAHPWDWRSAGFDDHGWLVARELARGNPYGQGTGFDHALMPRTLPAMEESPTRFARVRRAQGIEVPAEFVAGKAPITVPAHAKVSVLLDQGFETSAFPQLVVSGGKGAEIKLTYAEALFDEAGQKGNRDAIEGRQIVGVSDEFLPDGGERRLFTTINFRTYRYVQLDIATGGAPLRVEELSGIFTGYPFRENGSFKSDDPALAKIWEVGWRTARLCAFETYVDCPYYEQLQYVGDTRIQALISLYVSGDDRLMRNAIELFDRSRIAEGLTQSRYPSATPQVINTFSLWWIEMVRDYWMHRGDEAFVRARLPGIEAVLAWFERRIDAQTGLLGPLEYWTFVDWPDEWAWNVERDIGGEPSGAREGGSSIVSLQLAMTLRSAAEICRAEGKGELAARYEKMAEGLRAAVIAQCWDAKRRLVADTAAKTIFSQHANALAVLAGAVTGDAATDLMQRVAADGTLIQASTYFRFYLLRAMKLAGLGDEYLAQLGPWRAMLELGLTTFAERPEPTRSDCHAWSASPVYEFLATVAGVEPASPGFASVKIEPHLGKLAHVEAVVPHPAGEIAVKLERVGGGGISGEIKLPTGLTGTFRWNGRSVPLHAGAQTVRVE